MVWYLAELQLFARVLLLWKLMYGLASQMPADGGEWPRVPEIVYAVGYGLVNPLLLNLVLLCPATTREWQLLQLAYVVFVYSRTLWMLWMFRKMLLLSAAVLISLPALLLPPRRIKSRGSRTSQAFMTVQPVLLFVVASWFSLILARISGF